MEQTATPVPIKTAVSKAISYVRDLYESAPIADLLLEEVEFSESTDQWLITIGFMLEKMPDDSTSLFSHKRNLARHYKIVHVNAKTGQPVSMKIREMGG